jgi:hypothetical protein
MIWVMAMPAAVQAFNTSLAYLASDDRMNNFHEYAFKHIIEGS